MHSPARQGSQPSFEYRLMQRLQEAIPHGKLSIEIDNPAFLGCTIKIWYEEAGHCIEYQISYAEMAKRGPDVENEYIAIIVKQMKDTYAEAATHR